MPKSKTGKQSSKIVYIDMREITDTLEKNEDVITNLIKNYKNNMYKIGDSQKSRTYS